MSADYTTLGLLKNLKRRGFIPAGAGLTTNDLLQVLTEQLRTYIPAFLKTLREEFIIAELEVDVTGPAVPIPARACGAALRTIGWRTAEGGVRMLTRIEPERRNDWPQSGSEPTGFMFVGNDAVLIPAASSGTLVVTYQQRPGELVLPSACAKVTEYDDAATVIVENAPSNIAVVGAVVDIVKGTPNFELAVMDAVVASVSAIDPQHKSIAFAPPNNEALPTGLVGGYVCLAGETCIPRLPIECFDLLAQAAAFQLATDQGNERLPAIEKALTAVRRDVSMVLSPRSDGNARVIVNRSGLGRRFW